MIGDVVNVASRLCDMARTSPSGVLATRAAVDAAGEPGGVAARRAARGAGPA